MLIIGLTGGIASGKTTVADMFAEFGIDIIDSDVIAREIVEKGTKALTEITEHFSKDILDDAGNLDRKKLREKVFNEPAERKWLEKLTHPLIRQSMVEKIQQATSPYCFLVIPLLVESFPNPLLNRILVVDVPEEIQIKRVMLRDKSSKEQAQQILDAQASRQQRLDAADDVIENSKDIEFLRQQVNKLHEYYLKLERH